MQHSMRDRERNQRRVNGRLPVNRKKKAYQAPHDAKPCRVKDSTGMYYSYDAKKKILDRAFMTNIFHSRRQAHNAIFHTIEALIAEGKNWKKEDFQIENIPT